MSGSFEKNYRLFFFRRLLLEGLFLKGRIDPALGEGSEPKQLDETESDQEPKQDESCGL